MMFKKLRGKLKAANTSTHATLEFAGASDKIAAVHHFGLADRVRAGIQVVYTARPLLGINPADEEAVREILLKHLSL
jgi:phage virion morphogenesis protein